MDEARAPTAGRRRSARWRSRWLMPGVPAVVLVILTVNVLASGPLVGADQRIRAFTRSLAGSPGWHWLGGPARLIVDLANPVVAVTVLAVSAVVVGARRRSLRPLVTAAVAAILLLVTVVPGKILIGRLAPGRLRPLAPGGLGSFPSGHTTTASVCYVLAVLLPLLPLLPYLPARIWRIALVVMPVWCVLVGAALVWLNYHWFTDVAAGWALAAIIIQAALRLTRGAYSGPSTPPGVADERIASPSTT
jgi:membrane-associated phospholipid phosphatase